MRSPQIPISLPYDIRISRTKWTRSRARRYERDGKGKRTIKAQQLWFAILEAQVETGNPYMLYKDACNRKSNQQNLGTIKSSNLCTEIVEFTSPEETAVCNLASIALPRFVVDADAASPGGRDSGRKPARPPPIPHFPPRATA